MNQEIVADRASSQHLEGMNHLAALQREKRSGKGRIVPDIATVSDDRRQSVLELPNRFLVHEQTENAPGDTGNRIDAGGVLPEPRQALFNHVGSLFVLQSQQRDRRRLNMRARNATPYTKLFPEFHPPSTQARSRSISTPIWIRLSDAAERLQTVNCLIAMTLNAVGMTQLAEPEIHGQPYLSGSKRTLRSAILNFHRQNQWPSLPWLLKSQD
jgi:hypothetical protein